jgi:hypothetical protein
MKQLSKRMTEQRLRTLEHLRAGMTPGRVRILPRDVEQGLKEFASGVEQLVDRLVTAPPCSGVYCRVCETSQREPTPHCSILTN